VRVVSAGQNGVNPSTVLATLDVVSGSVSLDSTADVRGTVTVNVTPNWWPTATTDPVTPYGNELFIESGVVYGDGSKEWVSQGYFRIDSVAQQNAPLGTVEIAGSDRMAGLQDARTPYPLTFPAGEAVITVIEGLVLDVYPWATFDLDSSLTGKTLATAQTTTDDRSGFLTDLITSYGLVGYWDYQGIFVAAPPPDPSDVVTTISSGQGGVLVSLSRTLNRDSVYNAVVASGEQLDDTIPPVSALVIDDDPTSPTYWFGQFGQVPKFYSSSFLTTVAQCQSAGLSILQQSKGLPYSIDFGQVPNAALEPLDPVGVNFPGRREQHVLSQLVIPLDARTAQTAQTRQLLINEEFS
jgi:hypothetical protein